MKYILMTIAAGAFLACNEGPADRMEDRSDRNEQERTYETPEMSGEYEEMREPIDAVHPPVDALPADAEIRNDSLIVPDEGMKSSSDVNTSSPATEQPVNSNSAPVTNTGASTTTTPMTGEATVTPPTTGAPVTNEADPAGSDIGNDPMIEPANDGSGAQPVMPESDSPHHSEGSIDTLNTTTP